MCATSVDPLWVSRPMKSMLCWYMLASSLYCFGSDFTNPRIWRLAPRGSHYVYKARESLEYA